MSRQDIIVGLKNSIERGYSLEQAKMTLINSGYSQEDVDSAAMTLTGGMGTNPQQYQQEPIQQQQTQTPQPQYQQQTKYQQYQQPATQNLPSLLPTLPQQSTTTTTQTTQPLLLSTFQQPKQRKPLPLKIIILIIILLILIGTLIVTLLFKASMIEFLKEFFRK